jgi:hypothetical protein
MSGWFQEKIKFVVEFLSLQQIRKKNKLLYNKGANFFLLFDVDARNVLLTNNG